MDKDPRDSRLRFSDGGVIERDWDRMDLAAMQPYWLIGLFPLSVLPRVAQTELDRGSGGDAVLILLVLDPPDNRAPAFLQAYRADVNGLVLRALREVGVVSMTIEQAWRQVIREEAALLVIGAEDERAWRADNLSWMFWKTGLDELRAFNDLDWDAEEDWEPETHGLLDQARVDAAVQLLRTLDPVT